MATRSSKRANKSLAQAGASQPTPSTSGMSLRRNSSVNVETARRNSTTSTIILGSASSNAAVGVSTRRIPKATGPRGRASTKANGGGQSPIVEVIPKKSQRLKEKAVRRAFTAAAAAVAESPRGGNQVEGRTPKVPSKRTRTAKNDETDEYEVETILDVKTETVKFFKVKWRGFPAAKATWEPEENLDNCKNLITAFERKAMRMRATAHPAPAPPRMQLATYYPPQRRSTRN